MADLPATVGPYRMMHKLGEGGMGIIFEGIHQTIERRVAIKFLHADVAHGSEAATRFFNEARAVNRIVHQGLVQIFDYGVLADGRAYLVMELLEGQTLGQRIKARGRLPVAEAVYLARQIADAIAAAHEKEIIHRDLKPDNVMIIPDSTMPGGERTKLLDFGLAKVKQATDDAHVRTNSDALFGTPAYMSPEQCKGAGQVDTQSDVYSFGVMLFEMLTGRHVFPCQTPGEMISHHLLNAPPALQAVVPQLPHALSALVNKLLRKQKEARPTMAEVVVALDALNLPPPEPPVRRGGRDAPRQASDRNPTTGSLEHGSTISRLGSQRPASTWRRARMLPVAMLFLIVLPVVLLAAQRFRTDRPRSVQHSVVAVPPPAPAPPALSPPPPQPPPPKQEQTEKIPPKLTPPKPYQKGMPGGTTLRGGASVRSAARSPASAPQVAPPQPASEKPVPSAVPPRPTQSPVGVIRDRPKVED